MEKVDKYTLRLLEYIDKLNFVDILGIGNILGVEEQEDFEAFFPTDEAIIEKANTIWGNVDYNQLIDIK